MPTSETAAQPIIVAIMTLLGAGHRAPADGPSLGISGAATTTAVPASFYSFTPNVFQNGGRALSFSIKNKPSWASFGLRHGTLYGVPRKNQAGTYSNIIITVTDGQRTVNLPPFSIIVGES